MDSIAFPLVNFVNEKASEEYLCAICRDVMSVPVQIGCNGGHVYCRNCIILYIQSQPSHNIKCPTCATPFHPNSVFQIPFIQRKINDLLVMCHNYHPNNNPEMKTPNDSDCTDNKSEQNESKLKKESTETNNNIKKENKCTSPLRRSKRIQEKQTRLSGQKRKQPDITDDTILNNQEEDNDIIILNNQEPLSKKQKMSNDFCEWKGRYGDLKSHVQKCPLQLINCKYFTIGCKQKIKRKNLEQHMNNCEYCPILCPQCQRTTISRGYLDNHLMHDCIMTIVQCNECKNQMKRMDLLQHKKKMCGETLIMCEYRNYGCDVIKRKDEKKHNAQNMERHLKLIKDSHNNLENQVTEIRKRLEQIERYQTRVNNQNGSNTYPRNGANNYARGNGIWHHMHHHT